MAFFSVVVTMDEIESLLGALKVMTRLSLPDNFLLIADLLPQETRNKATVIAGMNLHIFICCKI
jgi:hypothetical protein